MTRYTFRMPIDGTIEVTANGDTLDGADNAETDLDYIENPDRVEALGYYDDDGNFVDL